MSCRCVTDALPDRAAHLDPALRGRNRGQTRGLVFASP